MIQYRRLRCSVLLLLIWHVASLPAGYAQSAEAAAHYRLQPVDIQQVRLEDKFWLPIIRRVQEITIGYALQKCEQEGRMENFLIAGGKLEGETRGAFPFDDTDVYKIIEGASNTLISADNPGLSQLLDTLIAIIAVGQEADGYLTTWRSINPAKPPAPWVEVKDGSRWESLGASHELYNAGHLYEAAYTHFIATGKRNFLDIALKNADLIVQTFGDNTGQISNVPGHQIIETGLIKLYQATGNEAYLQQARYFLDGRGNPANHALYGPYSQDHMPVTQQREVVGHAVRAVYMYAAMTDIAVLMQDAAYDEAAKALWQNMASSKTYLTGGIGALHEGEAFGAPYQLPNLTAYSETCASIGSVYWNHRLHRQTADVQYLDLLERTLYNALLAGLSFDGTRFFYPNALEADGVYTFNRGHCTRQDWFDCSCCPTNLIRFLPALPGLLYSRDSASVYVNLYAANTTVIDMPQGRVELTMRTDYPWDGRVEVVLLQSPKQPLDLKFRIPGWVRNEPLPAGLYRFANPQNEAASISLNGEPLSLSQTDGYFSIRRAWKAGDRILLNFPMSARTIKADVRVSDNAGKLALSRGPFIYAFEEADNPKDFEQIELSSEAGFGIIDRPDLLGGIQVLALNNRLAIPYYAWSNRGIGKMKVWLPSSDTPHSTRPKDQ